MLSILRHQPRMATTLSRPVLHARAFNNQIPAAASQRFYSTAQDEYIHESIVHTLKYQNSLLRLPVPKLYKTCQRYLLATEPLLTPEEHDQTKKAVSDFLKNAGPVLQKRLRQNDRKNKHTSYIAASWYDVYLKSRDPLPINFNPHLAFKDFEQEERNEQCNRAAELIFSSLRFMKTIHANKLEPEIFHTKPHVTKREDWLRFIQMCPEFMASYPNLAMGAYPLDMSQYPRLFRSTRVPHLDRDLLVSHPDTRHVVVMCKNQFFKVDVLDENMRIIPSHAITGALKQVVDLATAGAQNNDPAVGVLTAENRDTWADARRHLEVSKVNAESLKTIDGAIFTVCLDDQSIEDMEELSKHFLCENAENRWFDKSFSMIVTKNGKTTINFEHAWGDGVAVLRYFNEVYDDSKDPRPVDTSRDAPPAQKLGWEIDDKGRQYIEKAQQNHNEKVDALELRAFRLFGFGKDYIKSVKLSPDGIVQQAFQIAYYRMYNKTVSTYESASTAAFKHGRTEVIRPASLESKAFVEAFCNPDATNTVKKELLKKAVDKHSALTKDAVMGQGVDRHLFALRELAMKENPEVLPELFTDKAYSVLGENMLSTSTLGSHALMLGGFGPVAQNGYGVAYFTDDDNIGYSATSYGMNTDRYMDEIKQALLDMQELLG
eukprot:GFYU01003174.1.p1 GENE.GFYU01003174.1~~GFYU01003174.1.p1  ORF type:complete len:660 (-),score=214.07 GFYU01003174.1:117-2096(-)